MTLARAHSRAHAGISVLGCSVFCLVALAAAASTMTTMVIYRASDNIIVSALYFGSLCVYFVVGPLHVCCVQCACAPLTLQRDLADHLTICP